MTPAGGDAGGGPPPADLRYEAFRGDAGIELIDFGVALADPAAVSERRPARRPPSAELTAPPPAPALASPALTPDAAAAPPDAAAASLAPAAAPLAPAAAPPAPAVSPPAVPRPDADELEKGLVAAKQRGDLPAYLALIKESGLIVPSTGRPDVIEFPTTRLNDGQYVLTFTTAAAMNEALGGQAEHFRHVTAGRLAAEWPNPAWKLSINLGLPSEAYIDASVLTALAPLPPAEEAAEPAPKPLPEPAQDDAAPAPPAVMQKVVPHALVVHYLEGGYDRVAGYVHRADDVADLTTPERLVRGLGLTYENSSFSLEDEAIHVIRWPVHKPALFKTPFGGVDEESMRAAPDGWVIERPPFLGTGFAPGDGPPVPEFKIASQRLPHGAEMYRIDRSAEVTRVAVFDADGRRWAGEAN